MVPIEVGSLSAEFQRKSKGFVHWLSCLIFT